MCVGVIDGDREVGKAVINNQQERHPQRNILIARVATVHIVSIVMAMTKMWVCNTVKCRCKLLI